MLESAEFVCLVRTCESEMVMVMGFCFVNGVVVLCDFWLFCRFMLCNFSVPLVVFATLLL